MRPSSLYRIALTAGPKGQALQQRLVQPLGLRDGIPFEFKYVQGDAQWEITPNRALSLAADERLFDAFLSGGHRFCLTSGQPGSRQTCRFANVWERTPQGCGSCASSATTTEEGPAVGFHHVR